MNLPPYPQVAWFRGLTGRVLIEFQIDQSGRAVSENILGADAAPVLQDAAAQLIRSVQFDTTDPRFNPSDTTPFRETVRFCIGNCGAMRPYPGTDEGFVVLGSP